MIRMCFLIFVIYLKCGCGFGFLNEPEKEITVALIKKLEIRHWILAENTDFSPDDLNRFKDILQWKIPVLYTTPLQLFYYFLKETFPNINTLIVLKVKDIGVILTFFYYLTEVDRHDFLYKFKWIAFLNDPSLISYEHALIIPYNCLFIIAEEKNDGTYYLKEIYKVKKKTFVNYYGSWSKDFGLSITNASMYIRRRDLNNTELIMEADGKKEWCGSPRHCAHFEVLMDYSKLMNFRYRWVSADTVHLEEDNDEIDVKNTALAYSSDFIHDQIDYLTPLFKININWYIRKPRYLEQADYIIEPFSNEIWISIFLVLIISTAVSSILHFEFRYKNERPKLFDYLFLPFETLCNQDGYPNKATNPHRITCFTIRFFALFIVPAYSGTIISYLAVRKPQIPFKTLKGFVKNDKYSIGARTGSFSHQFFQQNNDPLFQTIYTNYFTDLNDSEVMNKLCHEPFAFVEMDNDIYNLEEKCPVYRMRRPIAFIFSGTPMQKNSPFTKVFNHNFIRYYSSGIQDKMQKKVTGEPMEKPKSNSFRTVSIKQMSYVFLIIPIGIFLSVAVLFCEIIFEFFRGVIESLKNR